MKPVLQAILFLGLITPSFSAAPEINFDGASKKPTDIMQALEDASKEIVINVQPKRGSVDGMSIKVSVKSDSGEWVEQKPERMDDVGVRYSFLPDTEVEITYSCTSTNPNPNPDYWKVIAQHTNSPSSGGHSHSNPAAPVLQTPAGKPLANPIASNVLPVNTPFVFYWRIPNPAYATRVIFDAKGYYACGGEARMYFDMKVPYLEEIKAGTGYTLGGTTPQHPSPLNHYVSSDFKTQLLQIGKTWKATCSNSEPLIYNDMSLPWGGLFDIKGTWAPSHKLHRFGNNADVSKKWVRKGNRVKLVQMMCNYAQVHSEGDGEKEKDPHYHLTLKSSKHLDDFPDPLDEKYMDCCLSPGVPIGCINLESYGAPMEEVMDETTNCP